MAPADRPQSARALLDLLAAMTTRMTSIGVRPHAVFRRAADVRFRTVVDECVVIRQESDDVLVLNRVGARVLELLDGKRTVAEVEAALGAEFDAPAEQLARDLATHLGELVHAGIVADIDPPVANGTSGATTAA